VFSYDPPRVLGVHRVVEGHHAGVTLGPTIGGSVLRILGRNFQPASGSGGCLGMPLRSEVDATSKDGLRALERASFLTCDSVITHLTEQELPREAILFANDTMIEIVIPEGTGRRLVLVQAANQHSASSVPALEAATVSYDEMEFEHRQLALLATTGGSTVVLSGRNFGPAPLPWLDDRIQQISSLGAAAQISLALAPLLPIHAIRIDTGGGCSTNGFDASGALLPTLVDCAKSRPGVGASGSYDVPRVLRQEHELVEFEAPIGVGGSVQLVMRIIDAFGGELAVPYPGGIEF